MSVVASIVDGVASVLKWRAPRRNYGWKPSPSDPRDYKYLPSREVLAALSKQVDMRDQDGPIFNQSTLGSCTANCWLGMFMFEHKKQFSEIFQGSRLQLYFDERKLSGNQDKDTGAYMRDGAKCMATIGACPESMWPYDTSKFTNVPSAECYAEAAKHKIVNYQALDQNLDHLKASLNEGHPFLFGFNVASSFESASVSRTGIVPMPKANEKILGGHCMVALGYIDEDGNVNTFEGNSFGGMANALRLITGSRAFGVTPPKNVFICRNSWGEDWGDGGYCYVPYQFVTDKKWCDDFWTIRSVSNG